MPAPMSAGSPPLASVTEAFGAASPHLPDLNYWWPDGIGTVLIEPLGANRWLPGVLRAISLHPSGCVRLCALQDTDSTGAGGILSPTERRGTPLRRRARLGRPGRTRRFG